MSLTEAVLIAGITFVLVVVALAVAFRLGLGKEFQKAVELREQSRQILETTRRNQQESREYMEAARKSAAERNEGLHAKGEAMSARTREIQERQERNQERWLRIFDRAEALLDRLEKR